MSPRRRDHVHTLSDADPGHGGWVAPQTRRGGIDHRLEAAAAKQRGLGSTAGLVVQLIVGKQRGDLKEVLVVIGATEIGRIDVTQHGADQGHQRTTAATRASSSTVSRGMGMSKTSAMPWV